MATEMYSTIDQISDIPVDRLIEICAAEQEGRLVVMPCRVGDTVYVITNCESVHMRYDDDYEFGTGASDCPFEKSCEFEECDDTNQRIFETTVSSYWIESDEWIGVFLEHLGSEIYTSSFGKTVFLTREEAEAALAKGAEHDGD